MCWAPVQGHNTHCTGPEYVYSTHVAGPCTGPDYSLCWALVYVPSTRGRPQYSEWYEPTTHCTGAQYSIMALYSEWYGPVLGTRAVSGRNVPLTVLGPSNVSNMALCSELYGPVLGPSTVSNLAVCSEWYGPVLIGARDSEW